MKYYVNQSCIGCGLCANICPEVFEMNENGTAQANDENVPDDATASAAEAMQNCPVSAIEQKE